MKKIISALFIMCFSYCLFGQLAIEVPYQTGQTAVEVKINYPANIKAADSVRLEATYQNELDPVTEFIPVKTVKDNPGSISAGYSFQYNSYGERSYRCIVFQQGKEPIISNVATIIYDPSYKKTELGKVSNVQYEIIEKGGEKYIHLTWDAVPNALGYLVAEKIGGGYYKFQLSYGGPYSITSKTYLDIPSPSSGDTREFGICGVYNPYDFVPTIDILTLISVVIP